MIIPVIQFPDKAHDWNLGHAMNCIMERAHENDWVCFFDNDVMFTTPDFIRQMEDVIERYPHGTFSCMTNRVNCPYQVVNPVKAQRGRCSADDTNDIAHHREVGRRTAKEHWAEVMDCTDLQLWSSCICLMSKKTWLEVDPIPRSGFKGTDNKIHLSLRDAGRKVYIMKGIYVFHWYDTNPELPC